MNLLYARGIAVAIAAIAASSLLVTPAVRADANEACYDFSKQTPGTAWPIDAHSNVDIGIGAIRVRPLKLDGVVQTPNAARFEAADTEIAGGAKPEMAGTAVAIQMLPAKPVQRISLRYAIQPGANQDRAAMVEVNGVKRDWRGGFDRLHEERLGPAAHPVRFTVTAAPSGTESNFVVGRLTVEGKAGIKSFTLGAGFMRIDDVCFVR